MGTIEVRTKGTEPGKVGQRIEQQVSDGTVGSTAGDTAQKGSFGALLRTILWELLAIGLVALATYSMVSLIIWLISQIY